jgi:hypothetical protein
MPRCIRLRRLPDTADYYGRDVPGLRRWLEEWAQFEYRPDEVIDCGARVLMACVYRAEPGPAASKSTRSSGTSGRSATACPGGVTCFGLRTGLAPSRSWGSDRADGPLRMTAMISSTLGGSAG